MIKNFFSIILILFLISCSDNEYRLNPSNTPAVIPADSKMLFPEYVEINRKNIRMALQPLYKNGKQPFGNLYSIDTAVNMRSPYQIVPNLAQCKKNKDNTVGFLLLHGLSDSPYVFADIKKHLINKYPCAVIRATLMPGHGTIPGDSLHVSYKDWIQVMEYGIQSFTGSVNKLYLVGFSTGSTLALYHIINDNNSVHPLISGLIMLSPAIEAKSNFAFLAPIVSKVKAYESVYADRDVAKYESFSFNFAAQYYSLSQELHNGKTINVPVFMAVASDDETINAQSVNNYFCKNVTHNKKRMIWYQGVNKEVNSCPGVTIIHNNNSDVKQEYRFINHSHVGITLSPDNKHYGFDKEYRQCLNYFGTKSYEQCIGSNQLTLYGELNLLNEEEIIGDKLLRRVTANPNFDSLMVEINSFIYQTSQP
jgi:esterase/lipase